MYNKRKFTSLTITYIFILILVSFLSFAVCDYQPDKIIIYSGSYNLGNFVSGNNVYILPDLNQNNLKFEFYFNNSDTNCFSSENDLKMKLFASSSEVSATTFTNETNNGTTTNIFTITFNPDITMTSAFTSTFSIKNGAYSGSFNFNIDNKNPVIELFSYSPTREILKPNEEVQINYRVSDFESGLDYIRIGDEVIDFGDDRNQTYTGLFSITLNSDSNLKLEVYDKFGHKTTQNVSFKVDSQPPEVSNLVKSYSYNGQRKISFSLKIKDSSFTTLNEQPIIVGDFSEFNSIYTDKTPDYCNKLSDEEFECFWNGLILDLDQTKDVNLKINVSDSLGNSKIYSFSEEIFVDKEGPEIENFALINSIGVSNIFSSYGGNNSIIYLRFKDASLSFGNYRIIPNFDKFEFLTSNCEETGVDEVECYWTLDKAVEVYKSIEYGNISLSVEVVDYYGNPSYSNINVLIDNVKPEVDEIEIKETNSIQDGIIQSGEEIDFSILYSDKNAISNDGKSFALGLFNTIDFREEMKNLTEGNCQQYNASIVECEFNGIVVGNGYMKRNISIVVFDSAGNGVVKTKEVEILKVGDEEVEAFVDGKTFTILNPINRNAMMTASSINAWFEGNLEFVTGTDPEMQIVNYGIKPGSCNESELEPLLIIENTLYPDDIKYGTGNNEEDTKFVIKTSLKNHENINDLNDKTMKCTLSVLKRDGTTLYSPEEVEINLKYSFYDIPRGTILHAQAEKVMELIDDAEVLGSWFDKTYKIYKMFDKVCSVVGTANSVIAGVNTAWTAVSNVLHAITVTKAVAEGGDKLIEPAHGLLGTLFTSKDSFVKKACDWVTCRNGGLIGAFTDFDLKEVSGLKQVYEYQSKTAELLCDPLGKGFKPIEKDSNVEK